MRNGRSFFTRLQMARTMMAAAILLIAAFQAYWIDRLYKEERQGLQKETSGIFRDVIYNLQVERFKADTLFNRRINKPNLFVYNAVNAIRRKVSDFKKIQPDSRFRVDSSGNVMVVMAGGKGPDSLGHKQHFSFRTNDMPPEVEAAIKQGYAEGRLRDKDTAAVNRLARGMGVTFVMKGHKPGDSLPPGAVAVTSRQPGPMVFEEGSGAGAAARGAILRKEHFPPMPSTARVNVKFDAEHPEKAFVRMISDGKALDDTIPVYKIDSAFRRDLARGNINLSFLIRMGKDDSLHRRDTSAAQFHTRPEFVGFVKPNWYQAEFENPAGFLLKRISPRILFSLFLVAFTSAAFIFLYRNLSAQRRLTEMKNDFISNITHELKTPIATVSVAVEALRNFGGMQSPERTKEYLDISASELQRLGLLVDKVLKLSLFENRDLEMKKETVDLKELTAEVLNTMKLQFEKHHAQLNLETQGYYFTVDGDRLHITSVIYNLLDNALKYSKDKPQIDVLLRHDTDMVVLAVTDKGIGIAPGFKDKIFDKFFRVPTGDHHNIKGYGLGLSYVSHVVKKHGGTISVETEPGKGSTFTVKLPVA